MVILIPFLIFVKFSQIWISCVLHEAVGSPSRINDVKKTDNSFLEYIYLASTNEG